MTAITLSAHHDRKLLAEVFRRSGRIHIPDILEAESADYLFRCVRDETDWSVLYVKDGKGDAIPMQAWLDMAEAERNAIMSYVCATGAHGFQFFYNGCFLHDGIKLPPALQAAKEFLNSAPFLKFVKDVTGANDIHEADAQATLYKTGHFLNEHDDSNVPGEQRRIAYVLNLTPLWRPDWGGSLQFVAEDGHIIEGYTPVFNAINMFRVPQRHFVSAVAPHAGAGRYSITGWLRAKRR
jgi:hypothetical protein